MNIRYEYMKMVRRSHRNRVIGLLVVVLIMVLSRYRPKTTTSTTNSSIKLPLLTQYTKSNATFYSIFKSSELTDMLTTVQSIESRFNNAYHYDWVFISNRRINDVSRKLLSNAVSGMAHFHQIPDQQWRFPSHVDRSKASKLRRKSRLYRITSGVSDQHRFATRYVAGDVMWSEVLKKYRYAMRVEPLYVFECDVDDDFFKVMESQGLKMMFVRVLKDVVKLVESLWGTVGTYLDDDHHQHQQQKDNLQKFFINDDNNYDASCYVSGNLQIFDLDFLRSETYLDFFTHLDKASGWFYERWTFEHAYTLLSMLFLNKHEIRFLNIPHSSSSSGANICAIQHKEYISSKCFCDANLDMTFDNDGCLQKLITLMPFDDELQKLPLVVMERLTRQQQQGTVDDGSLYVKIKDDETDKEMKDDVETDSTNNDDEELDNANTD